MRSCPTREAYEADMDELFYKFLPALVEMASSGPEMVWLNFGGISDPPVEESECYCDECAQLLLDVWREVEREDDGTICYSGMGSNSEDKIRSCDGCGCRLSHSLTDVGVDEEMAMLEEDFKDGDEITPEIADTLERIISSAAWYDDTAIRAHKFCKRHLSGVIAGRNRT